MRVRVVFLGVVALIGRGTAVKAQSDTRPLMVNEVRAWCADGGLVDGSACDRASYETLPDGSLGVVLDFYDQCGRLDDDNCLDALERLAK